MSQRPLAAVVRHGDETAAPDAVAAKKTALEALIAALDANNVAGHFVASDTGVRIASLQAQLRALLASELETITHRTNRTGPFTSP